MKENLRLKRSPKLQKSGMSKFERDLIQSMKEALQMQTEASALQAEAKSNASKLNKSKA